MEMNPPLLFELHPPKELLKIVRVESFTKIAGVSNMPCMQENETENKASSEHPDDPKQEIDPPFALENFPSPLPVTCNLQG